MALHPRKKKQLKNSWINNYIRQLPIYNLLAAPQFTSIFEKLFQKYLSMEISFLVKWRISNMQHFAKQIKHLQRYEGICQDFKNSMHTIFPTPASILSPLNCY